MSLGSMVVSSPRIIATLNGVITNTVMQMSATASATSKGSTFELTLSAGESGSSDQWLWSPSGKVTVAISMCVHKNDEFSSVFTGLADNISFDPINRVARVQGRDYSSVLINSSFQNSFCNQTASEIAHQIAARHGFGTNITATTNLVGSYHANDYNQIILNAHSRFISEWDLLSKLATSEGFELFVADTTLVFSPMELLQRNFLSITNADVKHMSFYRNCPLSSQTRVVVKSWNSWLNQMMLYTDAQPNDPTAMVSIGPDTDLATEIAIIRPNLTQDGTEHLAQRYMVALNNQTLNVNLVIPGRLSLRPRDVITIAGNGASFDADYCVRSVRWRFSASDGFTQYVHGFATPSLPAYQAAGPAP
jgi:hypothetical protein